VIVGLMTSFVPGIILFAPPSPLHAATLSDWPFFLQLGALAAVFMYLMAQAYARAEAQQLAPIHYTELIYASMIGFLLSRNATPGNLHGRRFDHRRLPVGGIR
jgi:drug/metabolite transporter (DMT)-like permease